MKKFNKKNRHNSRQPNSRYYRDSNYYVLMDKSNAKTTVSGQNATVYVFPQTKTHEKESVNDEPRREVLYKRERSTSQVQSPKKNTKKNTNDNTNENTKKDLMIALTGIGLFGLGILVKELFFSEN